MGVSCEDTLASWPSRNAELWSFAYILLRRYRGPLQNVEPVRNKLPER